MSPWVGGARAEPVLSSSCSSAIAYPLCARTQSFVSDMQKPTVLPVLQLELELAKDSAP